MNSHWEFHHSGETAIPCGNHNELQFPVIPTGAHTQPAGLRPVPAQPPSPPRRVILDSQDGRVGLYGVREHRDDLRLLGRLLGGASGAADHRLRMVQMRPTRAGPTAVIKTKSPLPLLLALLGAAPLAMFVEGQVDVNSCLRLFLMICA